MTATDLEVYLDQSSLYIRGEEDQHHYMKNPACELLNVLDGAFQRCINLPFQAKNPDRTSAVLRDGVLEARLEKPA